MTEYSEKLKGFIEENLPLSEKIFAGEILERAKANNLKIVEHKSFYAIYPEADKNVGLIIDKAMDSIEIKYSTEDYNCRLRDENISYSPLFGEGAVLFRGSSIMNMDFWNFSAGLLREREKTVSLPESVIEINHVNTRMTIFLSEAEKYLWQIKNLIQVKNMMQPDKKFK